MEYCSWTCWCPKEETAGFNTNSETHVMWCNWNCRCPKQETAGLNTFLKPTWCAAVEPADVLKKKQLTCTCSEAYMKCCVEPADVLKKKQLTCTCSEAYMECWSWTCWCSKEETADVHVFWSLTCVLLLNLLMQVKCQEEKKSSTFFFRFPTKKSNPLRFHSTNCQETCAFWRKNTHTNCHPKLRHFGAQKDNLVQLPFTINRFMVAAGCRTGILAGSRCTGILSEIPGFHFIQIYELTRHCLYLDIWVK